MKMKHFITYVSLFFASCLSACSTIPYGNYGLLAVKEVDAPAGEKIKIKPEKATPIQGSSCTALILLIPIKFGFFHMEKAAEEAVSTLHREDVVGVANANMKQRVGGFPPFYTTFCWEVEGVAAVRMK